MSGKIRHMTVVQYFDGDRPWGSTRTDSPSWERVMSAVRRMDDYYFPIVLLGCRELLGEETGFDDEESFNIIGGAGKLAMFHFMGEWRFERPVGSDENVRLWESDQGYFCQEKNLVYDIDEALDIVKKYYNSGSYDGL